MAKLECDNLRISAFQRPHTSIYGTQVEVSLCIAHGSCCLIHSACRSHVGWVTSHLKVAQSYKAACKENPLIAA